jgi:putative nucleotidyltransferase with HDIG domain
MQAALQAENEGCDEEIVLAAFFHDIGHLCEPTNDANRMSSDAVELGIAHHELVGARRLLRSGFSARVAKLVRAHVAAKRYLCYRQPTYYASLSDASKRTLVYQGGAFDERQALEFETDPDFEIMLKLVVGDCLLWIHSTHAPTLTVVLFIF